MLLGRGLMSRPGDAPHPGSFLPRMRGSTWKGSYKLTLAISVLDTISGSLLRRSNRQPPNVLLFDLLTLLSPPSPWTSFTSQLQDYSGTLYVPIQRTTSQTTQAPNYASSCGPISFREAHVNPGRSKPAPACTRLPAAGNAAVCNSTLVVAGTCQESQWK